MSVEIQNIEGVIADLDDGGLTESEAIEQIRDLLGKRKMPERVLITYLMPVSLTVNLSTGSVERAEMEATEVWGPLPGGAAEDADTNKDLDPDKDSAAIERAKAIADEGGWGYDIQTL